MSGGGGYTPTGSPVEACAQIYKDLNLLSPVPSVIEKLTKGSELEFEINEVEERKSLRVIFQGSTAGAITKHAAQIIKCIEQGHTYVAIVTALEDGSCTLEARMKS